MREIDRGSERVMAPPAISRPHEVIGVIETEWKNLHLLVVGDVMLDKYIWGEVERISPEAPIPVVKSLRSSEQPGGAANVAMNAAALGAQVTVVGLVGEDADGAALAASLESAGVQSELIAVRGRPTISKTRILGGRQQMLRLDVESSDAVDSAVLEEVLTTVLRILSGGRRAVSLVILSDYAKGLLTDRVCGEIIRRARERGVPVIVDPKSRDFSRYRGATALCPNLAELAQATGTADHGLATCGCDSMDAVLTAGEELMARHGVEWMAVTLSERGITLLDGRGRQNAPARARQVFDVSGAGDTVTAVLALCMASGIERMASVRLANMAAGIVVGKVGTAPVHRHELIAALSSEAVAELSGKILGLEQMAVRANAWRAAGDRVVFTNGCFDLLHAGHITLLEEARRQGDRLIVGLNSDASVRALKGPSRPVNGEADRARLLAALSAVDGVVVFAEETPLRVILKILPDVLVKGSDYAQEEIVGADEVRSWGGEVAIVKILQGFSTTQVIAKALVRSA